VSPPPPTTDAPPSEHQAWFEREVHPHGGSLKAYLHKAYPAVRDVDDVVQESFLRIWRARMKGGILCGRAFLFTIARRLAIDLLRRDRRSPFLPVKDLAGLFVEDSAPDVCRLADAAAQTRLLVAAIETLPARCREIFVLTHVEGLSHREVAARLGLAESTVSVQAARGLRRCEEFVRRALTP